MNSRDAIPLLLRTAAVLIALAAAWDPVITSNRQSDAIVSVMTGSSADTALAGRIARELEGSFTVVSGAYAGADASVVAGRVTGEIRTAVAGVPFIVLPAWPVELLAVHAPTAAPLDAVTPIIVEFRAAAADAAEFVLLRDDAVLDRTTTMESPSSESDAPSRAALSFVPAETGTAVLRVEARHGGRPVAAQDVVMEVRADRWRVHFHDGRPSWLSTFVRRTTEQDPRFLTGARVVTSRDVATEFGAPAAALRDARSLAPYDVIVVGAPETLSAAETSGLETYMRRRGGTVVLLPDRHADGAHLRLMGAASWTAVDATPVDLLDAAGTASLRAGARAWPVALPPGAVPLLMDGAGRAIVWRRPVGAGSLVVSGALDAWRFRDPDVSAFDAFWPALLAEAAAAAPPPLLAEAGLVARPGEWTRVDVTLRDAVLAGPAVLETHAAVSAALAGSDQPLPLFPTGVPGVLAAEFRAPARPGVHTVRVVSGDDVVEVPIVVRHDPAAAGPARELVHAWARSGNGAVLDDSGISQLGPLITAAVAAAPAPRQWHPMRSPWWLLPFVAALAGEWWLRRRRGLP